jgi:hypothetical protein
LNKSVFSETCLPSVGQENGELCPNLFLCDRLVPAKTQEPGTWRRVPYFKTNLLEFYQQFGGFSVVTRTERWIWKYGSKSKIFFPIIQAVETVQQAFRMSDRAQLGRVSGIFFCFRDKDLWRMLHGSSSPRNHTSFRILDFDNKSPAFRVCLFSPAFFYRSKSAGLEVAVFSNPHFRRVDVHENQNVLRSIECRRACSEQCGEKEMASSSKSRRSLDPAVCADI